MKREAEKITQYIARHTDKRGKLNQTLNGVHTQKKKYWKIIHSCWNAKLVLIHFQPLLAHDTRRIYRGISASISALMGEKEWENWY